MPISLKIYTKTPNTRDFCHKNSLFKRFHAEYTKKSGHLMRFFQKIGKFALFSIKLTINRTIWVENSEESDFSGKQVRIFIHCFSTNNYMWIHSSTFGETIIFPHKTKVDIVDKSHPIQTSTIIVENTENSPNSSSYTIEHKIVRNSHLLSQNWHFLKCHSNCSTNKCKLLTHKSSKQQLTAHMSIVKGNTAKWYKHAPFSSNPLLCSLVLKSQLKFPRKVQNK